MIFIVGTPRSGTTMLGRSIGKSSDVTYFDEPNVIWRYKNWRVLGHDEFKEAHTNEVIVKFIRSWFLERVSSGIPVEKTPANALRLNFVSTIFPQAKYIFIYRDPEAVVESMERKWISEVDKNSGDKRGRNKFRQFALQAKRFFNVPLIDKPAYFQHILSEVLYFLVDKRRKYWGLQYAGYQLDVGKLSAPALCLKQWAIATHKMSCFSRTLEPGRFLEVSYGSLVAHPQYWEKKLENFCGVTGIRVVTESFGGTGSSDINALNLVRELDEKTSLMFSESQAYIAELETKLEHQVSEGR